MTYKPTKWVNAVYDDEGNILRKGTPIMAENMNNIENELVRLSQNELETDGILGNHEDRITNSEEKIEGIDERLGTTENKVSAIEISKGSINGIATLDENGIVPSTQLPSNLKEIKVVPTLTERDTLERFEGLRVMVLDASADDTVNSGWAEYVWSGTEFIKVAEAEGIDLVIKWADVENKPTEFNPKKHSHTESEISDLDKYTKQEVDTKLGGKANTIHRHSASEIDGLYSTHEHSNKEVIDTITQRTLEKIDSNEQKIENLVGSNHTHSNKDTLDKLVYTGAKPTIDLITIEEMEKHTHDYNNLENKPTKLGEFENDRGFISENVFDEHLADNVQHITSEERSNWDGAQKEIGNHANKKTSKTEYGHVKVGNTLDVTDGVIDMTYEILPSDNPIISADTVRQTKSETLVKMKEVIVNVNATVRVKFDLRGNVNTSGAHAQLYKNDTAIGDMKNSSSTSWVTNSQDITVQKGDRIQIYGYRRIGVATEVRNFRVCYDTILDTSGWVLDDGEVILD